MTIDLRALTELVIADHPVTEAAIRRAARDLDEEITSVLVDARARMDCLRARDRELSVLMSSLRELAEVRDLQPLLQKLVDRAHELMGTDLTYFSGYDEETDELFVRANQGAVILQTARLQLGLHPVQRVSVLVPADSLPGAECFDGLRGHREDRRRGLEHASQVHRTGLVGEHEGLLGAAHRACRGVVAQESARSLGVGSLAHVALGGAGAFGELGRVQ